ncbi:uncharacterized protein LOC135962344 [Calliphora vicina]|uniref:uncharacterized protein LOC135962344 n=1 Tax=Calliphora vicina TaxID=7373 RepID=UPI00325AA395
MKLLSRSTLGVIIGIICVLIYFSSTIYAILGAVGVNMMFKEVEQHQPHQHVSNAFNAFFIILIIIFVILTAVSALLIFGIVKKRHNLMLPWLILSAIAYVYKSIELIRSLGYFHLYVGYFLSHIFGLVIAGVVIWLIFSLFRDIRQKNIEGCLDHIPTKYPNMCRN